MKKIIIALCVVLALIPLGTLAIQAIEAETVELEETPIEHAKRERETFVDYVEIEVNMKHDPEAEKQYPMTPEMHQERKDKLLWIDLGPDYDHWTNWENIGIEVTRADEIITAEVAKKAQVVITEELSAKSNQLTTANIHVEVNAEGKVISNQKNTLSQETIIKLATIYYQEMDFLGNFWMGHPVNLIEYEEKDSSWVIYFFSFNATNTHGGCVRVALSEQGDFLAVGH